MGAMGTIFNAASITMSSYQSVQDAKVRSLQANLAADGLETQAARKDLEADEALKIGELNQAEQRIRGRREIASQRAGYAASGVSVNSGSALEMAADQAAWSEYQRQKIEYESSLESWGLRYDAALLRQEAANTRSDGIGNAGLQAAIGAGKQLSGLFK